MSRIRDLLLCFPSEMDEFTRDSGLPPGGGMQNIHLIADAQAQFSTRESFYYSSLHF